jgi:hypothetical protein
MRTSGPTENASPRNSTVPVRCCSGRRFARDAIHERALSATISETPSGRRASTPPRSVWSAAASRAIASRRASGTPAAARARVDCFEEVSDGDPRRRGHARNLFLEARGLIVRDQRVHDVADGAVHARREVVDGEADAVIGHAVLGKL